MGSDGDTFDGDLLYPSPELFKLDTTNGPCEGVCCVARSRAALKRRTISIAVMRSMISSPPTLAGCLVPPLRLDLDELLC